MFNNHGKELQRKIHPYSLDQLPLDSSHHLDPNHRRDQLQTGNNRLLVNDNSPLEEVHSTKDTSSHSIHFTEEECSDTCGNVHSVDILVLEQFMHGWKPVVDCALVRELEVVRVVEPELP